MDRQWHNRLRRLGPLQRWMVVAEACPSKIHGLHSSNPAVAGGLRRHLGAREVLVEVVAVKTPAMRLTRQKKEARKNAERLSAEVEVQVQGLEEALVLATMAVLGLPHLEVSEAGLSLEVKKREPLAMADFFGGAVIGVEMGWEAIFPILLGLAKRLVLVVLAMPQRPGCCRQCRGFLI